jgi:hypothetical protein
MSARRTKKPDLSVLARVVLAEDAAGRTHSTRRHVASALLAEAVVARRCETCGDPVPDDVVPAERVDGALELSCAGCDRRLAQERSERIANQRSA